jgi:hypothetical protein
MVEESSRQVQENKTSEATYRAIGRFIRGFSSVEHTLRFHLAIEVKLDMAYCNAVVTHDFALLCTGVQEVFGQTLETEEKKKELKKLISRARELNDLRVKIVHGNWWPDFEGGTLLHVSRRSLREEVFAEMAAHLEKQVDVARELYWGLTVLLSRVVVPPGDDGPAHSIVAAAERLLDVLDDEGRAHLLAIMSEFTDGTGRA